MVSSLPTRAVVCSWRTGRDIPLAAVRAAVTSLSLSVSMPGVSRFAAQSSGHCRRLFRCKVLQINSTARREVQILKALWSRVAMKDIKIKL